LPPTIAIKKKTPERFARRDVLHVAHQCETLYFMGFRRFACLISSMHAKRVALFEADRGRISRVREKSSEAKARATRLAPPLSSSSPNSPVEHDWPFSCKTHPRAERPRKSGK
jgi:hypothetical protein